MLACLFSTEPCAKRYGQKLLILFMQLHFSGGRTVGGRLWVCKVSKTEGTVSDHPWRSGSNAERGSRLFIACRAAMRFSVAGWVENRSEIPVGTM